MIVVKMRDQHRPDAVGDARDARHRALQVHDAWAQERIGQDAVAPERDPHRGMPAPRNPVGGVAVRVWAVPRHPVIQASSSSPLRPGPVVPHILAAMAGFTNIVVCLDDSDGALRALATARALRADGGSLTLVHVIPPPSFLTELAAGLGGGIIQDQTPLIEIAEQWIATVANDDEDSVVLEGNPTHMVAEWAGEHDADVIVVARHGSPERTVLGSFTQKLIGIAPCAVLLVHAGDAEPEA